MDWLPTQTYFRMRLDCDENNVNRFRITTKGVRGGVFLNLKQGEHAAIRITTHGNLEIYNYEYARKRYPNYKWLYLPALQEKDGAHFVYIHDEFWEMAGMKTPKDRFYSTSRWNAQKKCYSIKKWDGEEKVYYREMIDRGLERLSI